MYFSVSINLHGLHLTRHVGTLSVIVMSICHAMMGSTFRLILARQLYILQTWAHDDAARSQGKRIAHHSS